MAAILAQEGGTHRDLLAGFVAGRGSTDNNMGNPFWQGINSSNFS